MLRKVLRSLLWQKAVRIISTLIHDISIRNCTDWTFDEKIIYNRNILNANKDSRNKCLQCLHVADNAQNWGCRPGWGDRATVSHQTRLGAKSKLRNTGTALAGLWFCGFVMEQDEEHGRNIWREKVLHTNWQNNLSFSRYLNFKILRKKRWCIFLQLYYTLNQKKLSF